MSAPHQTRVVSSAWRTGSLAQLLLLLLLLSMPGCVRRRLTVRSNPPGAKVYVDDQEIGVTPVSANFTYYAARKITLIKDGYRTETHYERFLPPWYEVPPLDLVSENFYPREIRDERVVDFQLLPQEIVRPEELLGRAEGLRDNARAGTISPLLPKQGPPPFVPPENLPPPVGLPGQGLPENSPLPYPALPPPAATSRRTVPIAPTTGSASRNLFGPGGSLR